MFESIKSSIRLIKESFRVLRHDPELVLLTAFSFIGVAIVAILAGVATLGTGVIDSGGKEVVIDSTGYMMLALAYFLGYFLIIYFQVALVCAVQFRIAGGDPNVWYGIAEANRRLSAILSWTVIAATVGLLLGMLEGAARSRRGGFGLISIILVKMIGMGWGLLVFFVIPVIAAEGIGGFAAIRRSASIIKKKWGEAVVGAAGVGLIMFLLSVVAAGPFFLMGWLNFQGSGAVDEFAGIIFVAIGVVVLLGMTVFSASLNSTYRAVLFNYANTGETRGFNKDTLDHAFTTR